MNIFRFLEHGKFCLGLELSGGRYDLSAASSDFADISAWLRLPDPVQAVFDISKDIGGLANVQEVKLCAPVDEQEVWASGVTYFRSKAARMEESSDDGDFYDRVYEAERPELFFKASAKRVVGHGDQVRVRRDSTWNVPEPELALVLSAGGSIVGYTIGNDMSSRSIEGENPLYLPQAKVYDGGCSLGPVIAVNTGNNAHHKISMTIVRKDEEVFAGETSTSMMRRTMEELAGFLFREMTFEDGVVLLTGTGIVPPDDFTLQSNDKISITIDGIGTLENTVA